MLPTTTLALTLAASSLQPAPGPAAPTTRPSIATLQATTRQSPDDANAAFRLGVAYSEAGQDALAIPQYEHVLTLRPNASSVLQNLAQANQNLGRHEEALKHFTTLFTDSPDESRYLAKIIQLNTALGRTEAAAKARTQMFEFAKAGKVTSKQFCREQFNVGDAKVLAFETFDPVAPENIRYTFHILRPTDGKKHHIIDYGSADGTTSISRELKDIPADAHIFNLDGYPASGGHVTWYLEPVDLTYDQVKTRILDILAGKANAVSASNLAPESSTTRPATK